MGIEIERKFLVINDSWRESAKKGTHMRQGYLTDAGRASVRIRVTEDKALLNIKSATKGISRSEYEYEIPLSEGHEMLSRLALGPLIEKNRYEVQVGDHLWEVDIFEGDNQGLEVAEIELGQENEQFILPDWAGMEVSDDTRYFNASLVKHPFNQW